MIAPSRKTRTLRGLAMVSVLAMAIPSIGSWQDPQPNKTGYDLHCALCHGEDGSAVETLEKLVNIEIPHLGSSYVQKQSDAQIRTVILEGKGKMNPVQTIAEEEIAGVIAFLRTLREPESEVQHATAARSSSERGGTN